MSQYFPPCRSSGRNMKVEIDLSNYATKNDLKHVTHVDVSSFASKRNLVSLKTEVDKIDVLKLQTVPVDLAKLSVIKNVALKKIEYNKLVTKVDYFDTTDFVKKAKYEKDGADLEKKRSEFDKKNPDLNNLIKKTDLQA